MNRYDIALGKSPPVPTVSPKSPRWRPTVVRDKGDYFPGHFVILTKFVLETAKAKRICTKCKEPIYATEPCLRAGVVDQTKHQRRFWSKKIQLCNYCIQKGEVQRVIKKYESKQDPTKLFSEFWKASDKVQRLRYLLIDSHPYGKAQDYRNLYENREIRGAQPHRAPSGITGVGW